MCANYRPSSREALATLPLPPPDFAYGEAYPGISQLQKVLCTMALWLDPRSFVLIGFFSELTAKNFL